MEVVKDLSVDYPDVAGKCYFIFVYKSCTRILGLGCDIGEEDYVRQFKECKRSSFCIFKSGSSGR